MLGLCFLPSSNALARVLQRAARCRRRQSPLLWTQCRNKVTTGRCLRGTNACKWVVVAPFALADTVCMSAGGLGSVSIEGVNLACWTWSWWVCEWPAAQSTRLLDEAGDRAWGPCVLFVFYGPIKELILTKDHIQHIEISTCVPHLRAVAHPRVGSPLWVASVHFRLWAPPGCAPTGASRHMQAWAWVGGYATGPAFLQPASCPEPAGEPVPGAVPLPLEGARHHELAGGERP